MSETEAAPGVAVVDKPRVNIALLGDAAHGCVQLFDALGARPGALVGSAPRHVVTASEQRALTFLSSFALRHVAGDLGCCDGFVVVVRAAHGVSAATREQLTLARALGATRFVALVNTRDAARGDVDDADLVDVCEYELRALLEACGFAGDDAPVITGDAGDGAVVVERVLEALDAHVPAPVRDVDGPVQLAVRWWSRRGRGQTVVAAHIKRGTLRLGDRVQILGNSEHGAAKRWLSTVTSIEHNRKATQSAAAGDVVGCIIGRGGAVDSRSAIAALDVDGGAEDAPPGPVTARRSALALADCIDVDGALVTQAQGGRKQPLFPGFECELFIEGTAAVSCAILCEAEMLMPGDRAPLQVMLRDAVAVEPGQRVVARAGDGVVGHGRITRSYPWRRPSTAELARRARSRAGWWLPAPAPPPAGWRGWSVHFRPGGIHYLQQNDVVALVLSGRLRGHTRVCAPSSTTWERADTVPLIVDALRRA